MQSTFQRLNFLERRFEFSGARRYARFQVTVQVGELALELAPREMHSYAGQYFFILERLRDVVIGTGREGTYLILGVGQSGHENHWNLLQVWQLPQTPTGLEAVDAGHHDIEQH